MFSYFFKLFRNYIFNWFDSLYRSLCLKRTRRNSDSIESMESVPLVPTESPNSEEDWLDKIPLTIPLELVNNFKSGEDWLDDWEDCVPVKKKPYTFDDKVDDYRRNIKVVLEKTEKQEETEVEVDLMFADLDDDVEDEEILTSREKFTPACSPSRSKRSLADCELGAWDTHDSDWEDQDQDDHPNIRPDKVQLYV